MPKSDIVSREGCGDGQPHPELMEVFQMSDKRWVSRALVDMLIEMKQYDSAAEVVSGSEGIFVVLSKQIGDTIARAKGYSAGSDFLEVQKVLDEAKEEIKDHQQWQQEVLKTLPKPDDDRGLTRQLRQAFSTSATARAKLLNEVMRSHDHCLKAQEGAFRIER
jgi:thioredoxin-related protein